MVEIKRLHSQPLLGSKVLDGYVCKP